MAQIYYQYYVEGKNEKKLINTLKVMQGPKVVSGSINVFNPVNQKFTEMMLVSLRMNTIVILVFDTDKKDTSTLQENIAFLKRHNNIKDVWCVMQCENLEDELVRSTDIDNILSFYNSKGISNHKKNFNKDKNLGKRLEEHGFNLFKLWTGQPSGEFISISNDANKIKLVK